jgi:hypothetical protein
MLKVLPSQLPVYATIMEKSGRMFMRDSLGGWSLLYAKNNAEADKFEVKPKNADKRFLKFEVVAVPVGWDATPYMIEEELEPTKDVPLTWRDIPGYPTYETSVGINGYVFVRNKKSGDYRRRRENGFFVLYQNGKKYLWCEGELGSSDQIEYFYKTGVVGVDL